MARWLRFRAVALSVAIVHTAAAEGVPPAVSTIRLGWMYPDPPVIVRTTEGSDLATFDASTQVNEWQTGWFNGTAHSMVGNGAASVSIRGSMSVMNARTDADANVYVYLQIGKLDADAPDVGVPVIVGPLTAYASTQVGEVGFPVAIARAFWGDEPVGEYPYWPPSFRRWTQLILAYGHDGTSERKDATVTVPASPGEVKCVHLQAWGYTQGGYIYDNGSYEAWVDPRFSIDPTFEVEVRGEMVPATSVYALELSENVPEPGAAMPLAALGAVACLARRRGRGESTVRRS